MFDLNALVRPNIRTLKPYSSARSEFLGTAEICLDANENAFPSPAGNGLNRYPDPLQYELKRRIGGLNGVSPSRIFLGNGSDEAIDLLFRIFCEPGSDEVIMCPPTYGMYSVSAGINDVKVREVPLTSDFKLDVTAVLATTQRPKLIFICSPNNPTGNLMDLASIIEIARSFDGIVVVDEAYIQYAASETLSRKIEDLPNLVVLQTFSKAWGMAGARVGLAYAREEIVRLMNKVKPPYNLSSLAQRAVLEALGDQELITRWSLNTVEERRRLASALSGFTFVETVYPSDANFLLVKFKNAGPVYRYLLNKGIVVRDRSKVKYCEGCLRITVGTPDENERLIEALGNLGKQVVTE